MCLTLIFIQTRSGRVTVAIDGAKPVVVKLRGKDQIRIKDPKDGAAIDIRVDHQKGALRLVKKGFEVVDREFDLRTKSGRRIQVAFTPTKPKAQASQPSEPDPKADHPPAKVVESPKNGASSPRQTRREAIEALLPFGASFVLFDGSRIGPGSPLPEEIGEVKELRLHPTEKRMTERDGRSLTSLDTLQFVEIQGSLIDSGVLNGLLSCRDLERLHLNGVTRSPGDWDASIGQLAALPKLKHLLLQDLIIEGRCFKSFRQSPLEDLTLQGNSKLGAELMSDIAALPSLRRLAYVHASESVRPASIAELAASPNLKQLLLGNFPTSDADLAPLAGMALENFRLSWSFPLATRYAANRQLGDEAIRTFASMPNLQVLFIHVHRAEGASLPALAKLGALKQLALVEGKKLRGDALSALAEARSLKDFNLEGSKLDSAAFQSLGKLQQMTRLDIANAHIDTESLPGLAELRHCTNLLEIRLDQELLPEEKRLDARAVPFLGELKQVQSLRLNLVRFAKEDFAKLSRLLPDCRFSSPFGGFGPGAR